MIIARVESPFKGYAVINAQTGERISPVCASTHTAEKYAKQHGLTIPKQGVKMANMCECNLYITCSDQVSIYDVMDKIEAQVKAVKDVTQAAFIGSELNYASGIILTPMVEHFQLGMHFFTKWFLDPVSIIQIFDWIKDLNVIELYAIYREDGQMEFGTYKYRNEELTWKYLLPATWQEVKDDEVSGKSFADLNQKLEESPQILMASKSRILEEYEKNKSQKPVMDLDHPN